MFATLLALGLMSNTRSNDRQREIEYRNRKLVQRNQELLEEIANNTSVHMSTHVSALDQMNKYMLKKKK